MTATYPALLGPPALGARRWPRARWGAELRALAPPRALSWVSVRAAGPHELAAVSPWRPVVSLRYDPEGDCVEVATPGAVHRIARPVALFSLSEGAEVYRVVVVGFDGGLDLIDVAPGPDDDPEGEGA